ncbi:MAG: hypothetical protein ACMXYG_07045 [Candidatus Woesearchaeota archaeon]
MNDISDQIKDEIITKAKAMDIDKGSLITYQKRYGEVSPDNQGNPMIFDDAGRPVPLYANINKP